MLASTFPVGAGDGTPGFVRDLARAEAEQFETTVLAPAVPGCRPQEWFGPVDVRRFRFFPRHWEDLASGAILENLRARPSRWLQVPALLVAEVVAVARTVRRVRPDVVHAHWIIPQAAAALVAARRVPLLVTTLGGDVYGLTDPLSRAVIRWVLRRAGHVTTMNADMRQRLLDLGAPPERTHVLPMGADVAGVREAAVGVVRQPRRVLFVGRMVEKKGATVLLAALRKIGDIDGLQVHVVGDGPLRTQLERQARELPVTFLGALPRTELAREYAAAAVVVVPSVSAASGDQDGLPVVLLEAMAAGCAVIASDLAGINEAVQQDVSGVLVPPGDAGAVAATLTALLEDEPRRRRLGAAALERAEEYSMDELGRRYVELLHTTIRQGPRTRT